MCQMTETCEVAVNLELLKGILTMGLIFLACFMALLIGVTIKTWLVDLAHYIDGGE